MTQAHPHNTKPPAPPAESEGSTEAAWTTSSGSRSWNNRPSDPRFWRQPVYFLLILTGLALNMFSGNWVYLHIPLPLDRLFVLGGLLLAFLDPNTGFRHRLRWRPIHWMMLTFTLWTIYSAMGADTLYTTLGFYALLDRVVVPFVLFSLGAVIFDDPTRRDLLLKMLVVVSLYLGPTAFFEIIGPHSLVFPRYIMNPELGILFGRARGPFITAEPDGMVLAMALFAAGVLHTGTTARLWKRLCLISIPLSAVGAVLCLTRSVWLGTILALMAAMYLVPQIRRPLIRLGLAAVAVGAAVLLIVAPIRELLIERFSTQRSLHDRELTNAAAQRIIEAKPLTGLGWHRFVEDGYMWVRQAPDFPITNVKIEVHNVFLSRAAELGIPAAALFVAILIVGPVMALRYRQTGDMASFRVLSVAAFIIWLVPSFTSPNPYPMPTYLMWLVTGIAAHRLLLKEPMRT